MGSSDQRPCGPIKRHRSFRIAPGITLAILAGATSGCGPRPLARPTLPRLAPEDLASTPKATVQLDASVVKPMYSELLAIDLPEVVRVATANNLDIQQARERIEGESGKFESSVGNAFPVFSPTALFEKVNGSVRASEGNLIGVNFTTFQPYMLAQWVINPGKVIHDILAARRRVVAAQYYERAVIQRTLTTAVIQYYSLALAQAHVAEAHQALDQARELLRVTQSRVKTGTGLQADETRAQAELAGREQELLFALKEFYDASVALAVTLQMEPVVTLAPGPSAIPQTTLVRENIPIEDLLALALEHRDDLQSVRLLIGAAAAARKATWWGGLGPQAQISEQAGGITGQAEIDGKDKNFGMKDQERFAASTSWKLGLSTFGEIKAAKSSEKQARIEAERKLEAVKAEVVRAVQDGKTLVEVIGKAAQQVKSAEESARLAASSLQAGTMTTLDVLHAQDVLARARVRYSEVVVRYNQAQVNLLAALGMIDESTLFKLGQ